MTLWTPLIYVYNADVSETKKKKNVFSSSVSLSLSFLDFYCFPLREMGSSRHSKADLNVRRFHRRRSRTILQPRPKGLYLFKIFFVLELAYLSLVFANSCAHGINRLLVRELLWFEGFKMLLMPLLKSPIMCLF